MEAWSLCSGEVLRLSIRRREWPMGSASSARRRPCRWCTEMAAAPAARCRCRPASALGLRTTRARRATRRSASWSPTPRRRRRPSGGRAVAGADRSRARTDGQNARARSRRRVEHGDRHPRAVAAAAVATGGQLQADRHWRGAWTVSVDGGKQQLLTSALREPLLVQHALQAAHKPPVGIMMGPGSMVPRLAAWRARRAPRHTPASGAASRDRTLAARRSCRLRTPPCRRRAFRGWRRTCRSPPAARAGCCNKPWQPIRWPTRNLSGA